jgi:hypothetical protein
VETEVLWREREVEEEGVLRRSCMGSLIWMGGEPSFSCEFIHLVYVFEVVGRRRINK